MYAPTVASAPSALSAASACSAPPCTLCPLRPLRPLPALPALRPLRPLRHPTPPTRTPVPRAPSTPCASSAPSPWCPLQVGDAAGRPRDHSDSDRAFSQAIMPVAPTWLGLGLRMGSTVLRRGSNPTPTFIRPSASASTRRPSFSRSCIRHDPMCQRDVAGRTLGPLPRCRSARRLTRRVSGAGSRLPRDPCALARRGRAAVYSNSLLSQESTCAAVVVMFRSPAPFSRHESPLRPILPAPRPARGTRTGGTPRF